jgi:flagellar biosynthesis component FlhA
MFILCAVGCGGHLKYTISDALLADVPVAEKHAMLGVQAEQAQLKQAQLQARSEQAVSKRDLSAAVDESRIAQLQSAKVQADVDLAKSTTDVNRIDQAKARLAVADLGRSAAEIKVDWRRLRLRYEEQEVRVLGLQARHAEARYEQEKARLAVAKGKRPSNDFSLTQFDLQVAEAQTRWDKKQVDVDRLKRENLQIESRYQALQQQLAIARNQAPPQAVPPAPPLSS